MTDVRETDVLVAGAGPAGAIAARLLARHGRQVTLVDPGSCATDRLEVLPPSGCLVLQALDLVDILHDPQVVRPCLGIRRRWGAMAPEFDDFLRRPGSAGYVIDRARFDGRLRAAASEAGVRIMRGRVVAAQCEGERIQASIRTCAGDLVLAAGVAVDATGRPAVLARRLGARRRVLERSLPYAAKTVTPTMLMMSRPGSRSRASDPIGSTALPAPAGASRPGAYAAARIDCDVRLGDPSMHLRSACRPRPVSGGSLSGTPQLSFDPITSQGLVSAFTTALAAGDTAMSPRGLDAETALAFSQSVTATAQNSERGRREVYQALAIGQNGA